MYVTQNTWMSNKMHNYYHYLEPIVDLNEDYKVISWIATREGGPRASIQSKGFSSAEYDSAGGYLSMIVVNPGPTTITAVLSVNDHVFRSQDVPPGKRYILSPNREMIPGKYRIDLTCIAEPCNATGAIGPRSKTRS